MKYLIILFVLLSFGVSGQDPLRETEVELMAGRVVPNYRNYPAMKFRSALLLNLGRKQSDKPYSALYNDPTTGLALSFSTTGNNELYGTEYSAFPYIILNSKSIMPRFYVKLGLGTSYFTNPYDELTNPENRSIGSSFTWAFRAFLYRPIVTKNKIEYRLGFGAFHSSNAHVQLPNHGLNSAMFSFSTVFKSTDRPAPPADRQVDKTKYYFMSVYNGLGFHELGGTDGGDIKEKKPIYSTTWTGGIIYRQFIKVRTGFSFRKYQHYYDFVSEGGYTYSDQASWYSSNLYWLLGAEFIVGHVGLNAEAGINIFKPFFDEFYRVFEGRGKTDFILKKLFPVTLGMNYYFLKPANKPVNNFFVGANIRANFGQADYMDVVLGYSRLIR